MKLNTANNNPDRISDTPPTPEEQEKVGEAIYEQNFIRGTVYSLIFMIFEIQMIFIFDMKDIKPVLAQYPDSWFRYIFKDLKLMATAIHICLLLVTLLFLVLALVHFFRLKKRKPIPRYWKLQSVFLLVFLSLISLLTLRDLFSNGKMAIFFYTYIFASSFLVINFPLNLFLFGISSSALLLGQFFLPISFRTHIYIFLNGLFICFVGIYISTKTYKFFNDKFLNDLRLQSSLEELNHLAFHDPLTGLRNRRAFKQELEKEFGRMARGGDSGFLVLMDIDHFKKINDLYGHDTGDLILKEISQTFIEELRDIDLVCRWGGEEFIFFFPNTTEEEGSAITERLRVSLTSIGVYSGREKVTVTGSFGAVPVISGQHGSFDSLYQRMDALLYKAKESGRNQVRTQEIPENNNY